MRLINSRYYFDYNSTSPLSDSVVDWLGKGDLSFGNPSSIHTTGKKSKKEINDIREYLFKLFSLKNESHELLFQSGATEGINNLIQGFADHFMDLNKKITFFLTKSDHPCILAMGKRLEKKGHLVSYLPIDQNGDLDFDQSLKMIKSSSSEIKLLNYTWVHNLTGNVWPLSDALKLKNEGGCFVHVDSAQAVGKVDHWNELLPQLDAYTFSGHKFGAMKGIGFSFVSKNYFFSPLIIGGGQQNGFRGGTENILGIHSLKLALQEVKKSQNLEDKNLAKEYIEKKLLESLGNSIKIVSSNARKRNNNTIYLVMKFCHSDIALAAFDIAGIDISVGSACSSGSTRPELLLLELGYFETEAKSALRLSFGPELNISLAENYADCIIQVLKKINK